MSHIDDNEHLGERVTAARGAQRRRSSLQAVLAVLAALVAVTWTSLAPARAAELSGAITSLTTQSSSVGQWDVVDLDCTWAVPDTAQPGDTFTLQLPATLKWYGSADFALTDPQGTAVATAHADDSGLVTFVLTDYVLTHDAVHGTCAFATQYTAATDGSSQDLEFTVGSTVLRVPITTQPPCQSACTPTTRTDALKSSWWTDGSQTRMQSRIETPAVTTDSADVVVEDTPGAGLALDCSTVEVRIGTTLDSGATVADPIDNDLYPPQIDCAADKLTVTVHDLPRGEMVDVSVESDITDPSLSQYTNTGTVTVNGVNTPVASQIKRTDASGSGTGTAPSVAPSASVSPTPPTSQAPTPSVSATPPPTLTTSESPTSPAGTPTAHNSPTPPPVLATPAGPLPNTGSRVSAWELAAALGLVAAGGVLVVMGLRRHRRR